MAHGIERIQEAIRKKVATILLRDLADPRLGFITITKVRLAGDFSKVDIHWSCLEEGGAKSRTEHALAAARGYIQREIAAFVRTRKAPHVEWVFDQSVAGSSRVDALIRQAREEDDARKALRPPEVPETPPTDAS